MFFKTKFKLTSPPRLFRFNERVTIGSAFVFADTRELNDGDLNEFLVSSVSQDQSGIQILPIIGQEVEIAGIKVVTEIPTLHLRSITSDKSIYYEGRDEIKLLVLDLFNPGNKTTIKLRSGDEEVEEQSVYLNEYGMAELTLHNLPISPYSVDFTNASSKTPACTFLVAEYKLVPLVGRLNNRSLNGTELEVEVGLESFGVLVNGRVRLELLDGSNRIDMVKVKVVEGVVKAKLNLEGEGPHSINVQLVEDPSRTATIPLIGSRISDRRLTTFSLLGHKITGSLMPGKDTYEVKGIHLKEGEVCQTPFNLQRVDLKFVKLTATQAIQSACFVIRKPDWKHNSSDPELSSDIFILERTQIEVGETVELEIAQPLRILHVGAIVDDNPWEGWAAIVPPCEFEASIRVPERVIPGKEMLLKIDTSGADSLVYITVKDARLTTSDTPASRLAGQIKSLVESISENVDTGYIKQTLFEKFPDNKNIVGWLKIIEGEDVGRCLPLGFNLNFIGSASDRDHIIYVQDEFMRDNHAFIFYNSDNGSFLLCDFRSNGTFLSCVSEDGISYGDFSRIEKADLLNGDMIRMGSTKFLFECWPIDFLKEKFVSPDPYKGAAHNQPKGFFSTLIDFTRNIYRSHR